jgi:hypothetical protein
VGGERALQVPRLPPDFPSGLVLSMDFMRLSLLKAAYVAVDESSVVGNPEFAPTARRGRRDDKVEGYASSRNRLVGLKELYAKRKAAGPLQSEANLCK